MATATKSPKTSKNVNLSPLSDRVVIQPKEAREKTAGGIYLPDTAKEKPLQGTVVAVGPGRMQDSGERVPVSVKVGETVLFGAYSGTEVKVNGVDYTIAREQDLLGVLEG
jgi:chaperonin GroES